MTSDTKICSVCKEQKSIEEFPLQGPKAKQPRHHRCKACHKILAKKHYEKNKSVYRTNHQKYRRRLKTWLRTYKATKKCSICGFDNPAALVFHHLDKTEKENTISHIITRHKSKRMAIAEIEKCIVLCANCHLLLHDNEYK